MSSRFQSECSASNRRVTAMPLCFVELAFPGEISCCWLGCSDSSRRGPCCLRCSSFAFTSSFDKDRELHVIPFLGEDMLDFPMFRKKSTLLRVMVCDDFQKHAYQPVVGFAQLGCQFLGVHVLEVESRLLGLENLRVEVDACLTLLTDGLMANRETSAAVRWRRNARNLTAKSPSSWCFR